MGENILASFPGRTAPGPETGKAEPGEARALSQVARAISERILVSDPKRYSKQEVRIMLKESVLPDTEIRISREGGTTRITLVTTSNDAYQVLTEQKEGMQNHLNQRLTGEVRVSLQGHRSDPGQSDGRSRQQRDLVGEWEEED
jgi:type III secretion system needle length determinant